MISLVVSCTTIYYLRHALSVYCKPSTSTIIPTGIWIGPLIYLISFLTVNCICFWSSYLMAFRHVKNIFRFQWQLFMQHIKEHEEKYRSWFRYTCLMNSNIDILNLMQAYLLKLFGAKLISLPLVVFISVELL